jgi:hypothetical protein
MSEALARIFALQQREINEQERRRRLLEAQRDRERAAFMVSGIPDIFAECANLPLKPEAQARLYKQTFAQCTYDHCDTRKRQVAEVSFTAVGGHGSGPRWACAEDRDSGRMRYLYSPNNSLSAEVVAAEPTGPWIDAFIAYVASVCDAKAVADKLSESQANHAREEYFNRAGRKMQQV